MCYNVVIILPDVQYLPRFQVIILIVSLKTNTKVKFNDTSFFPQCDISSIGMLCCRIKYLNTSFGPYTTFIVIGVKRVLIIYLQFLKLPLKVLRACV